MEEVSYGGCCLGLYCICYICIAQLHGHDASCKGDGNKSQPIPLDPNQAKAVFMIDHSISSYHLMSYICMLYVRSSSLHWYLLCLVYGSTLLPGPGYLVCHDGYVASERSKNCSLWRRRRTTHNTLTGLLYASFRLSFIWSHEKRRWSKEEKGRRERSLEAACFLPSKVSSKSPLRRRNFVSPWLFFTGSYISATLIQSFKQFRPRWSV